MKIKINTINPKLLFTFILVLQTMLMVAKGYEKEYFHLDEAFTFTLSNSKYGIQAPDEYKSRWRTGTDYYNLLVTTPDTKFNYKQTYINQTQDVHPPLYYFIIHTVSSLFPYHFSKWFGIIPNILFFLCTQVFIFLTANCIFNSRHKAILPCIIYGFSLGAIATVEFIRMYMMLTNILIIALYLSIQILNTKDHKYFFLLFVINTLGFLTHYYYMIMYFFIYICIVGFFYLESQYNCIKKYTITNSASLFLALICYPATFSHIFLGYRGIEAFQNVTATSFWERLYLFCKLVNKYVFSFSVSVIFLLLIIYMVYKIITIKKTEYGLRLTITIPRFTFPINIYPSPKSYSIFLLTFTAVCSLITISKIAAYIEFRYIAALYPFFAILTSYFLLKVACKDIFPKILLLLFTLLTVVFGILSDYQDQYKGYINFLSTDSDIESCIIADVSNYYTALLPLAKKYKNIYIIPPESINTLQNTVTDFLRTQKEKNLDVIILNGYPEKFKNIGNDLVNSLNQHYKIHQKSMRYITRIKIISKDMPE